jgi:surface antigen
MVIAVVGALLLSACQSAVSGGTGTAGANTGIVVGSQAAVGAGLPPVAPMEGILLGAELGRSLDASDREMAVRAEYEALEYARAGTPATWTNPSTGNSGSIIAGGVTEVNKLDCRDYTHTASIGGRTRVARGVACRQPGGTWRMTK